jgi:5-deoxy-glucuronate isomerase
MDRAIGRSRHRSISIARSRDREIARSHRSITSIARSLDSLMSSTELHYRSHPLPPGRSGTLVKVTPAEAGWDTITFAVRALVPGDPWTGNTGGEEVCGVLLQGAVRASWNGGPVRALGPRASVFAAYPHALYLPPHTDFRLEATEPAEVAECRAPSNQPFPPRVITPEDCGLEIRGGGNATRQIVDILPPSAPADRLMICEVFTPSGNWSSYPPHKHDVDNPPFEADLDETYYFRMREPGGYGFQRLYRRDGTFDRTFLVRDGDLLLIRDGYHPFVTAYGFDAYYLNVLAGSRRSMAASYDPDYAYLRQDWPAPDPRVPVVKK